MKQILLALLGITLCAAKANAVQKTWVGGATGSWSNASNWSPAGVPSPAAGDTLIFDGSLAAAVTIADVAAYTNTQAFGQFVARNNITLDLSGPANTFLYCSGGIQINAGSRVNIGAATTTLFVIGGNTTTAGTTSIAGTLDLKGNGIGFSSRCAYDPHSTFTFNAVATVSGKIIMSGLQAQFGNNNTGNLVFTNGSSLDIMRNGSSVPSANYQNGSTINITGVTTSNTAIGSGPTYNGLIIWNCPLQTTTPSGGGTNAFGSSITIDSLRIVSTGSSGQLRGNTEIQGVTIGNLEIDGGIFEIASPRSTDRTLTITNNLEVTGGSLILSGTDVTDNATKESVTVNVGGSVLVSAGSLNLCNRTNGTFGTYSTGNITSTGSFVQTGGLITETGDVPPVADASTIRLNGTVNQNLALANWTNQIWLRADNTTGGVTLQRNITCPDLFFMNTAGALMRLDNYDFTIPAANATVAYTSVNPARFVTNGTGKVVYTNIAGGSTVVFPVTPVDASISSVILRNEDLVGPANTFSVRVERGNNPGGIFNTGQTINRTWIINDAVNIAANSIALKFLYPDTVISSGGGDRGTLKELGHFVSPSWNIDPAATTRTPVLGGISPATDTCGFFNPNSLDSAFVLGNEFSILTLQKGITVNYFRGNKSGNSHLLHWAVNCTSNQAKFEIQRSSNGSYFTTIGYITASFSRCLLPFDFEDAAPPAGLHYYRIKVTDIDGAVTYSTMVLLQQKNIAGGNIVLQPTLIQQPYALLNIAAAEKAQVQIVVTDANGRQVQLSKADLSAGQNQLTLNVEKLRPGVYFVAATGTAEKWKTVRFVKL